MRISFQILGVKGLTGEIRSLSNIKNFIKQIIRNINFSEWLNLACEICIVILMILFFYILHFEFYILMLKWSVLIVMLSILNIVVILETVY